MEFDVSVAVILTAVVLYAVGFGYVGVFIVGMAAVVGWAQTHDDDREIASFVGDANGRET